MDKFAKDKKRRIGFFNELTEDYGPGKLVEKFHEKFTGEQGQFAELMNLLRDVDGEIREIFVPLKNTIKAARSSFNRREYVACVAYLGQYHDALESMMDKFSKLNGAVDLKHHEFLFSGVEDETLEYFTKKLPNKFKPKTASISDWWSNLTSSKGRSLKAWEQRFPKFAKKFKSETEKLLSKAESLQNNLTSSLKEMANLRASRKLEEYIDAVKVLTGKYKEFNSGFEKYYFDYAKKLIEDQEAFSTKPENQEIGIKKDEPVSEFSLESEKSESENIPVPFPKEEPIDSSTKSTVDDSVDSEYAPSSYVKDKSSPEYSTNSNYIPTSYVSKEDKESKRHSEIDLPSIPIDLKNVKKNPESEISWPSITPSQSNPKKPETQPESIISWPSITPEQAAHKPAVIPVEKSVSVTGPTMYSPGMEDEEDSVPVPPVKPAEFPPPPSEIPEVSIPKSPRVPNIKAQINQDFITKLSSLSNQNPIILAKEIIKFAEKQNEDVKKQLLTIAKNILK